MNQKSDTLPIKGILGASLLSLIFGANAVAVKYTYTGIGLFSTAGLRFLIGAIIIAIWAKATGRPFRITGPKRYLFILMVIFTFQLSLFMSGVKYTDVSRAALIINLQPFLVMILAHFFIINDRISIKKVTGISLGFAGIVMMFAGAVTGGAPIQRGDFLCLTATTLWGVNTVFTKRILPQFRPFHLVFYPMVFATPIYLTLGALFDNPMIIDLTPGVAATLGFQALTASAGFVSWTTLMERYGATVLNSFLFLNPVAGVITAALALHEDIDSSIIITLVLVVAGLLIINLKMKNPFPLNFRGSGS
jgi:drug/metabolite transporter (DMT)-like permease